MRTGFPTGPAAEGSRGGQGSPYLLAMESPGATLRTKSCCFMGVDGAGALQTGPEPGGPLGPPWTGTNEGQRKDKVEEDTDLGSLQSAACSGGGAPCPGDTTCCRWKSAVVRLIKTCVSSTTPPVSPRGPRRFARLPGVRAPGRTGPPTDAPHRPLWFPSVQAPLSQLPLGEPPGGSAQSE